MGQIKHIFEDRRGHVVDTPENRKLILDTASDEKNYIGTDAHKVDWYQKFLPSGKQIWVRILDSKVTNAGLNEQALDLVHRYNLKNNNKGKE